jgi:hypothetical protein
MKNIVFLGLLALAVAGCTSTQSIVKEYDAEGRIVKVTETSESVVTSLTKSTQNKTVIAWESGWTAYLSCSGATTEDPTPTFKMGAGKVDSGLISALPDTKWEGLPEVIAATRQDLVVNAEGIKNEK